MPNPRSLRARSCSSGRRPYRPGSGSPGSWSRASAGACSRRSAALGVGALAVAVPDAVYAGSMLADPLAYPLVLGALCAGVSVIADSTRRAQLAFVALTALTVATRIQYAVVPFAVLLGALAADRFRVLATIKRLWLSLVLLAVPPELLFGVLGNERVFGVTVHGRCVLLPVAMSLD